MDFKTEHLLIGGVPAVLYGSQAAQGYLFLHGQMGCKEEAEAFAQVVCPKGRQVLSIDLPGHGARRGQGGELLPWTAVPEIQIFRIRLRGSELAEDILRCLDTAIPSPLLFELEWEERVQVRACFKQATAPEKAGGYFCSVWHEAGTPRRPLPLVLDMEALYAALLEPLAPWPRREHEALPQWMQRLEAIADCERQMGRLEARLRREKQFNKKIPLNRELNDIKNIYRKLIH